jgi:hypothetical protein
MTALQEYLNQKYPTQKEKEEVKEITVNSRDFKRQRAVFEEINGGKLTIEDYPNLEIV